MSGKRWAVPREPVMFTPAGNPVNHGGSGAAYANYGCRCRECVEANTRRTGRRRLERWGFAEVPDGVEHGSASTYTNWGCRCEACSEAHSARCKEYYHRKRDSIEP